jgi:Arc/MetJ family transcription regulator
MCMSRTNIDLDDELVEIVMIDLACQLKRVQSKWLLRRLVEEPDQMKLIDSISVLAGMDQKMADSKAPSKNGEAKTLLN